MIKHPKSLFISILVHTILISTILFAWKNYSDSQKVEQNKKIHLKLSDVVAAPEFIKPKPEPKKIEQPKPKSKPKKIEQPKPKPKPKKIEKPKPKPKKVIPKLIKEPRKIHDFAVEEVPAELAIIGNKRVIKKESVKKRVVKKEVVKKRVIKKIVARKESVKKKAVKKEAVKKREIKKPKQEKSSTQYLQVNTQKIAKLLKENLYYPRSARKRNITGKVIIKFTLSKDARVYDIKVIESKNNILSRAAMKTIMDLSGKFPKPQKRLTLHVPIGYELK